MTNSLLTDIQIRKFPIPKKDQKTYWEKGLGVKVSQGGTKSFVLKHDNRVQTIGRYPLMSLKTARETANRLKYTDTPKGANS